MGYLDVAAADTESRHIVSLSGGKDSTALAVHLKGKIPRVEYLFCDTGSELKETYDYLDRVESYLGCEIIRLNAGKTFDEFLNQEAGFLPSPWARWCTAKMKIIPYEKYIGNDSVYSYIGIRADEDRKGYISNSTNIKPVYPFKEDNIDRAGVYRILEEAGLGLPKYYEWRSRSGCYFCFFQRNIEWVGLLERHPKMFEKAEAFEQQGYGGNGEEFTWVQGRSLDWIRKNKDEIKARHAERMKKSAERKANANIHDVFSDAADQESKRKPCDILCDL